MTRLCLAMMLAGALFFCGASYFLYLHAQQTDTPHCDVDSKAYLANAELFYYNNSFVWPESASGRRPYYTLGYAFILALFFKLFDMHQFVIVLVQVLLSLLCAFLLFDLAKKITGSTCIGVLAYLLICVNLGFLVFSQFILAEIWLSFFLILFFHRLVSFLECGQLFTLVQAALALSISVLIKPAALYFWPLLIPCFFVRARKSIKQFLLICIFWCTAFYLPLMGYALHNKLVFDRWYVCALDHENMIYWFFPNVLAHKYGTDQNQERADLRMLSYADAKKKFMRELKQSPHLFATVWLKNVAKTWFGFFTTNLKVLVESSVHGGDISYFKTSGSVLQRVHAYISGGVTKHWLVWVGYFELFWSLVRILFCFLGMLQLVRQRQWFLLYLTTSYVGYFSLITGHDGCARFRMLFEFVLMLLAALGVWMLILVLYKRSVCCEQKT